MRKAVPILVVAVSVLVAVIALVAFGLHRATHATPQFYKQALERDLAAQKQASEEFLQQAMALASDIERNRRWQIVFTAEQINGWLAVDVPKNMPDAIPREVQEPRVSIQPGEATIACRLKTDQMDAVVSLTVDVFVSAPNEIAVCFRRASLGALRVPIREVLEPLSRAAAQADLQLVWRQQDGHPVAVILLDDGPSESNRRVELEAIELGDGEMLVTGKNSKRKPLSDPIAQDDSPQKAASASKTNRQR